MLQSAGYHEKASIAEGASAAFRDVAGQLGTTVSAIRASRKTELQRVEDETKLAKARKDLADAQAAQVPAVQSSDDKAKAALEADTAMKKATAANLEAELAVRNARAALGPQPPP
jgi:hypothetical protein